MNTKRLLNVQKETTMKKLLENPRVVRTLIILASLTYFLVAAAPVGIGKG